MGNSSLPERWRHRKQNSKNYTTWCFSKEQENANSTPISYSNMTSNLKTSSGSLVEKPYQATEERKRHSRESVLMNKRSIWLPVVKAKSSIKKASQLHKLSISSLKTAQENNHVSCTVNQKENQPKKLRKLCFFCLKKR